MEYDHANSRDGEKATSKDDTVKHEESRKRSLSTSPKRKESRKRSLSTSPKRKESRKRSLSTSPKRKEWRNRPLSRSPKRGETRKNSLSRSLQQEEMMNYDIPCRDFGDFYCQICDSHMNSDKIWESHIKGKRHLKNIRKGSEGNTSFVYSSQEPTIQKELDRETRPIAGLEHTCETIYNNKPPTYQCFLCSVNVKEFKLFLEHITGLSHKLAFLKEHDKKIHKYVTSDIPKFMADALMQECIEIVERKSGKGKMSVKIEKENGTVFYKIPSSNLDLFFNKIPSKNHPASLMRRSPSPDLSYSSRHSHLQKAHKSSSSKLARINQESSEWEKVSSVREQRSKHQFDKDGWQKVSCVHPGSYSKINQESPESKKVSSVREQRSEHRLDEDGWQKVSSVRPGSYSNCARPFTNGEIRTPASTSDQSRRANVEDELPCIRETPQESFKIMESVHEEAKCSKELINLIGHYKCRKTTVSLYKDLSSDHLKSSEQYRDNAPTSSQLYNPSQHQNNPESASSTNSGWQPKPFTSSLPFQGFSETPAVIPGLTLTEESLEPTSTIIDQFTQNVTKYFWNTNID